MIIQCPKTGRACEVTGCNGCWEAEPVKQEPLCEDEGCPHKDFPHICIEKSVKQEPVAIGTEWKPCIKLPIVVHVREQCEGESHVSTRECITPVRSDDLIMRGVAGEEYPIGRELFNRTYTFDTTPPVVPQGEPVYYQWRRKNQPWSIRHVYHNKVEATTDDSEVRELYTTPPSVEAAIEATKEKAIAALQGVATGRLDVVEAIRSME